MLSLTNPINVPNIQKWQVTSFNAHLDDDVPWGEVTIRVLGGGGITYCVRTLTVYDAQVSMYLFANPTPAGYSDRVVLGSKSIANAFTTLQTANTGSGNRKAQLVAIETACLACGVVDASLVGT